jgi:hypothetical protein
LIQTSGPQRRNNPPLVLTQGFDGDGQRVKKVEYGETYYLLRSTVLGGGIITEIYGTANQFFGQKQKGHVYANGSELAEQNPFLGEAIYTPVDPSGVEGIGALGAQRDPLGNDVGDEDPYLPDNGGDPGFSYPHMGDMSDPGGGCVRDGIPMNCSMAFGKSRLTRVLDLFLPRFNRWRPPVSFPGTPPIASNSEITLGSIFQGATEGTVLGGFLNPKLDWRFIVPFIRWGSLYANPQNPTPTPTPCPGSIPEGIGKTILRIASQEHIDPTLLSVTMRHESSFGTNMTPNERWEGRGRNRRLVGWDVGPMQLATNIWQKSPFIDGLNNPFGTIEMSTSTRQYESFNGNFDENITVAARAFSMDILPRSTSNADAAGKYRGPGDYQGRYNQYVREAPADRQQLKCIAGRP